MRNISKAEKVKSKVKKLGTGEKVKVKVKLLNSTTYKGHLSESIDSDFVVVDRNGAQTKISYSDVDTIGNQDLSTGAKIGIGIGIGAAAFFLILKIWLYVME